MQDSLDSPRPIRVGVLARHPLNDPAALSGMPWSVCHALEETGVEIVELCPNEETIRPQSDSTTGGLLQRSRYLRGALRRLRTRAYHARHALQRPWDYSLTLRQARAISAPAQAMIDRADVDAILGVCASSMLYALKTNIPVVYASDATARIVNSTYPQFRNHTRGYRKACDEIEQAALNAATVFVAATGVTAESAINDYGIPKQRVRIIEFGANIVPQVTTANPRPPEDNTLELVTIAADPERKRLAFSIAVAEALAAKGWNARLHYIGPDRAIARRHPLVTWHGRLMLNKPEDRTRLEETLRDSHWMLLPSLGEAFGIAAAEAAHFGRPTIVTNTGGLPWVVQHDRTGHVMPARATPEDFAQAIHATSSDPHRYQRISQAAHERAQSTLSWNVFGQRLRALFDELITAV